MYMYITYVCIYISIINIYCIYLDIYSICLKVSYIYINLKWISNYYFTLVLRVSCLLQSFSQLNRIYKC